MPSGRPDWFGTIVAAGKYDTTFIPIGLDETGAILALMKGAYDSVLKTIAVDSTGVMKANISVQDLAELIMRPKYGAGTAGDIQVVCSAGTTTTLLTVNAKGMIYWGHLYAPGAVDHQTDQPILYLDESLISSQSFGTLRARRITKPHEGSMYTILFDDTLYDYGVGIGPQHTFESKVELKYNNKSAESITVFGGLIYATI